MRIPDEVKDALIEILYGKRPYKSCYIGKIGQVIRWMDCADCGYAHYKFVDEDNET